MRKTYLRLSITFLILVVVFGAFMAGFIARQLVSAAMPAGIVARLSSLKEIAPAAGDSQAAKDVDFGPMETYLWVLKLIRKNYVDKIEDDTSLALGSVDSMVSSLRDPYSRLLSPEQLKVVEAAGAGEFQGIGVVLGARKVKEKEGEVQKLVVVTPIPGGPAEKSGLLPGDILLKLDGKEIVETPPDGAPSRGMKELIDRLRNEEEKLKQQEKKPGTPEKQPETIETIDMHEAMDLLSSGQSGTVTLVIQRGAGKPQTFKISRAITHLPPVEHRKLADGTHYLRINQTTEAAAAEVEKIVSSETARDARFVIDLRRSPGGQLEPMIEMAGHFLPGKTVTVVARRTRRDPISAPVRPAPPRKVAVLVDAGTASTSEILAAALREKAGAKVIGTTTFGDTLVQDTILLRNGSAVVLTTAKLLSPAQTDIHGKGLKPDYIIPGPRTGSEKDDAALRKALAVLSS